MIIIEKSIYFIIFSIAGFATPFTMKKIGWCVRKLVVRRLQDGLCSKNSPTCPLHGRARTNSAVPNRLIFSRGAIMCNNMRKAKWSLVGVTASLSSAGGLKFETQELPAGGCRSRPDDCLGIVGSARPDDLHLQRYGLLGQSGHVGLQRHTRYSGHCQYSRRL